MQPRYNILKSAIEILDDEIRKLFNNKSSEALRKIPIREILLSKAVEHINTYYKFGENDFVSFAFEEDKNRLSQDNADIFHNILENKENAYIWQFNVIHDIDNFCRKLPFWTVSLSLVSNKNFLSTFIINPILDISISCEQGSGAINNQRKIRANKNYDSLVFTKSNDIKEFKEMETCQRLVLNSVSLELIYLSCGYIDFCLINEKDFIHYQDCILIAKESGILVNRVKEGYLLGNEKVIKKIDVS